jgi:transketolase
MAGGLPPAWEQDLPDFRDQISLSTRKASGKVLSTLAPRLPELVGGSADLTDSTNVGLPGETPFSRDRPGRYIHFGVREHGMGAILNGLSLHGGLRPFGSTFLIFSDYMRPSMRLAALMEQPLVYVLTHDSIALGEDGPTHEPVEHLASLRAMPGLVVIRPADAAETAEAWKVALRRREGPTAIVLSRQDLPVFDRGTLAPAGLLARGAYVLAGSDGRRDDLVLLASGSEVHVALAAGELLRSEHGLSARVVSMPSWELFDQQDETYRRRVLPSDIPARLAVEAAATFGWSQWTGYAGAVIGIDRFGASAPGAVVLERYGFTAENVVARALDLLRTTGSSATERREDP